MMNPTKRKNLDAAVKCLVTSFCVPQEQILAEWWNEEEENKIIYVYECDSGSVVNVIVEYEFVGSCCKIKSIVFN